MGVVAVRPFFFCDEASEEGIILREVSSRDGEALARRLVCGPGVIARTGPINSARLPGLLLGLACGVGEGSGASVAGELSVGDPLGLASRKAAGVGDGGVVGLGDGSAEMEAPDGVGIAVLNFGPVFFFLPGVDFLRGWRGVGVGVGGGPVKNLITFCPKDPSFSDVPRTGLTIATVITAIQIDNRLRLSPMDLIFCPFPKEPYASISRAKQR
jgi:hypothetical protein